MREQDFKLALRDTMDFVAQPPPMNETEVLDAAKRSLRRRRAMWASGASMAAVIALAVGAMLVAPGEDRSGQTAGASSTTTPPSSKDTGPKLPPGMTDYTARSGPRYEKGIELLNLVAGTAPPGYEAPDGLVAQGGELAGTPLRYHQATYAGEDGVTQEWEYFVRVPIVKAGKVGSVTMQVYTPGAIDIPAKRGCELTNSLGVANPLPCQEVSVGDKTIGVGTDSNSQTVPLQTAVYRYPDGTVVHAVQAWDFAGFGYPSLSEQPYTVQQLAELVSDSRFHLD